MLELLLTGWDFHDNQQSAEEQDDELNNKGHANPLCSQYQASENNEIEEQQFHGRKLLLWHMEEL